MDALTLPVTLPKGWIPLWEAARMAVLALSGPEFLEIVGRETQTAVSTAWQGAYEALVRAFRDGDVEVVSIHPVTRTCEPFDRRYWAEFNVERAFVSDNGILMAGVRYQVGVDRLGLQTWLHHNMAAATSPNGWQGIQGISSASPEPVRPPPPPPPPPPRKPGRPRKLESIANALVERVRGKEFTEAALEKMVLKTIETDHRCSNDIASQAKRLALKVLSGKPDKPD